MKPTVSSYDFHRAFEDSRPDNFSYNGLDALYKYLEEYELSTDEEVELDVIAFCCEYTEYESIEEFNNDYNIDAETLEDIEYHTTVIPVDDDRFIIQGF